MSALRPIFLVRWSHASKALLPRGRHPDAGNQPVRPAPGGTRYNRFGEVIP